MNVTVEPVLPGSQAHKIAEEFMQKCDHFAENGMSRTGLFAEIVLFISAVTAKTDALEARVIALEAERHQCSKMD